MNIFDTVWCLIHEHFLHLPSFYSKLKTPQRWCSVVSDLSVPATVCPQHAEQDIEEDVSEADSKMQVIRCMVRCGPGVLLSYLRKGVH